MKPHFAWRYPLDFLSPMFPAKIEVDLPLAVTAYSYDGSKLVCHRDG
jgi:hypothetical protein